MTVKQPVEKNVPFYTQKKFWVPTVVFAFFLGLIAVLLGTVPILRGFNTKTSGVLQIGINTPSQAVIIHEKNESVHSDPAPTSNSLDDATDVENATTKSNVLHGIKELTSLVNATCLSDHAQKRITEIKLAIDEENVRHQLSRSKILTSGLLKLNITNKLSAEDAQHAEKLKSLNSLLTEFSTCG